jgi:transcriptional regulator with XRE-family HTH domain
MLDFCVVAFDNKTPRLLLSIHLPGTITISVMQCPVNQIVRNRFSRERFPEALKGLMQERHLSYRQLAYKTQLSAGYLNHLTKGTRPVPADNVMRVIARALLVEPDFFLEFRLRQVQRVLDRSTPLADKLYAILLRNAPVPDDLEQLLRANGQAVEATND